MSLTPYPPALLAAAREQGIWGCGPDVSETTVAEIAAMLARHWPADHTPLLERAHATITFLLPTMARQPGMAGYSADRRARAMLGEINTALAATRV